MANPVLRIEKLSHFSPQRQNANGHTPFGMGMLDKAMSEDGFVSPMTAVADGEVIDGSARLEVAAVKFPDEAIVIEHDGTRPLIGVRTDVPNADDPRAKRIALRANRIAEVNLEYDPQVLQMLKDSDPEIVEEVFGADIEEILARTRDEQTAEEIQDVEPELDKAEELRKKWQTQLGQLWQLGDHLLIVGDCTKRAIVERLMGGQKAILLHADPPYGMGKEAEGIANDNLYGKKLDAFQMQWWKACRPSLEDRASVYIWGNAEDLWRLWYCGGLRESERLTLRNEVVWDKGFAQQFEHMEEGNSTLRSYNVITERCLFFMLGEQGFNNNADNYWEGWEPIRSYLDGERQKLGWTNKQIADWFGFHPRMADHWFSQSQWSLPTEEQYRILQKEAKAKGFKRDYEDLKRDYEDLKRDWYATRAYFDNTHDNMTDVWQFERVQGEERWGHATPKPVPMIERIMKSSASDKDVVLDPFLGSGSSLVAAQKSGRRCFGIEVDPGYVGICLQRWSTLTNKQPQLLT